MDHKTFKLILALMIALLLIAGLAACGDEDKDKKSDDTPGGLAVQDAWVRAVPMADAGSVTGAFLVINNTSDRAERLVTAAVSADIAGTVEIHETTMVNDVMQMRPVTGIDVPANGSVELKPGSYHIMLLDVKKALNPGDTVTLILSFESGLTLTVDAAVRPMEG
jgi:hypothetical protein